MRHWLAYTLMKWSHWLIRGRDMCHAYEADAVTMAIDSDDRLIAFMEIGRDIIALKMPKEMPGDMYSYVNDHWDKIEGDDEEGDDREY